ncbi:hypothetical protein Angca_000244 [Angiostrongylus cantonensis]|nr:hypothetical protein Angca_000244 [Angiostrongylus cantonensis]
MNSQVTVAHDACDMNLMMISDKDVRKNITEGEALEENVKNRSVMEQLCSTVADVETTCHERPPHQNDIKAAHINSGIARILFDAKGDALSEYSVDHSDTSSPTEQASQEATDSDPMDEVNMEFFREVLVNVIRETDLDIARLKNRKDMFQQLYVQYFGTGPDGSITDDGEGHIPSLTRKLGSKFLRRITNRIVKSNELFSHFDRLAENRKRRETYQVKEERFNSKRARYEDDDDWADTEACDPSGGIERSAKVLTYPYISQMEEERILSSANGSASSYAQNLAKVLFANTLDLYFKDQDPGKRQWIHRAVDFRFPSKDRSAQLMKWKNCSSAINKNMRMSERGPGEKPRQKEIDCKYVSAAYEEECYQKAQKDPVKYAEFLSLKLFEGSWDKYFKDQDVKLKDWLRQCIDRRFHLSDKSKRDARWKVCAAACNRNRTKIIGDDGNVNEYPYFPKEEEEECFRASNGVPHVYAEAMAKLLFPDTLHLFFKDQDAGKRNWLHDMLDHRFPTSDKLHRVAKWKSCTVAINKNMIMNNLLGPMGSKASSPVEKSSEKKESGKEDDEEGKKREEDVSQKRASSKSRPDRTITVPKKNEKDATEELPRKERESGRLTARSQTKKSEPYTSYPFVSEEDEIECFESSRKDVEVYARSLGRLLFKDTIKLLYKDQDEDRREWLKDILNFRFPTRTVAETKSKMSYAISAINKNALLNR